MDFGDYFVWYRWYSLGIPLHAIDRVIRSVAVSPAKSTKIVHGLIDYYGTIGRSSTSGIIQPINEKPISPDQLF